MAAVHQAFGEQELPHQISGEPVCFDFYFTQDPVVDYRGHLASNLGLNAKFNAGLMARNILKPGQKFYLSLAHSDEDLAVTEQAIREAAEGLR